MAPQPNIPSAAAKPGQPFVLRELFILTALVGATVSLVSYNDWNAHERWFLGLTISGTLLGIVFARMRRRRGWLAGVLAGTIGGLVAVGILARDWLAKLAERQSEGWSAEELAEFRRDYILSSMTTAVLAVLLAVLVVASYRFVIWATSGDERGMICTARRHPIRCTLCVTIAGSLILGLVNIDFLLAPHAWSPRHFIPIKHERMVKESWSEHLSTGTLSRNGDWLTVRTHVEGPYPTVGDSELYRLDPHPHTVTYCIGSQEKATLLAFDCDDERLAYLEYDSIPSEGNLHLVDLRSLANTPLPESERERNVHSLQWLPGGSLVVYYSAYPKYGYAKLRPTSGKWTREESTTRTAFAPWSRRAIEFGAKGARVIDTESSREVDVFSEELLASMTEYIGGNPDFSLKLSPNGRYLLAETKIYDLSDRSVRDWSVTEGFPQPHFCSFTPNGYAVYVDRRRFQAFRPIFFLTDVPFGGRLLKWFLREPVRLIDPASGLEVARTRPLWSDPNDVVLSYDGSRIAVFNREGVYVYDVPARFR